MLKGFKLPFASIFKSTRGQLQLGKGIFPAVFRPQQRLGPSSAKAPTLRRTYRSQADTAQMNELASRTPRMTCVVTFPGREPPIVS
jgi:hypothetical protein